MANLIQLRRGTEAEWLSANPVLHDGEIGISTDVDKFKIGDGATPWVLLAYATMTPVETDTLVSDTAQSIIGGAPETLDTLGKLATSINNDPSFVTTVSDELDLKLDVTTAADTYLTQTDASATYLTQTDATDTYLSQNDASATYLNQTDAANTYLTQVDASDTYATIEYVNQSPTNYILHPMFIIGGV